MNQPEFKQSEPLHHYGGERLVQALWDEELKMTSPCDFNDPLEFLASVENEEDRDWAYGFHRGSKDRFYLLCLTRKNCDSRMWAQYASNHCGLKLTLNFSQKPLSDLVNCGCVLPVDYQGNRPLLDRTVSQPTNDIEKEKHASELKRLLSTKGHEWEQEQEVRLFLPSQMVGYGNMATGKSIYGRYGLLSGHPTAFLKVPTECISKVTLGLRSSDILMDSVLKLRELKNAKWEVAKAKLPYCSFQIEEEPIIPGSQ